MWRRVSWTTTKKTESHFYVYIASAFIPEHRHRENMVVALKHSSIDVLLVFIHLFVCCRWCCLRKCVSKTRSMSNSNALHLCARLFNSIDIIEISFLFASLSLLSSCVSRQPRWIESIICFSVQSFISSSFSHPIRSILFTHTHPFHSHFCFSCTHFSLCSCCCLHSARSLVAAFEMWPHFFCDFYPHLGQSYHFMVWLCSLCCVCVCEQLPEHRWYFHTISADEMIHTYQIQIYIFALFNPYFFLLFLFTPRKAESHSFARSPHTLAHTPSPLRSLARSSYWFSVSL